MLLYLDLMCQCGLHAVLLSHIDTLMHGLAAEPRSKSKGKVFYGQETPTGESTKTEYGFNYQLLAAMY